MDFSRLDQFVQQHLAETGVPGAAVALTDRERLLYMATYGYADLAARLPVTPDTLFEIGSISKSFTSICLLQQMEAGRFDPQAPVDRYLPWFSIHTDYEPITAHHLLTHTAGITNGRDDIQPSLYQAVALRDRKTSCPPGRHFFYSNVGYQTLGYLLEAVSGRSLGEAIQTGILDPLGMTASDAVITNETRRRLSVGYEPFYDDRPYHVSHGVAPAHWVEAGAGDGSLACTPADLAAYLRMLLNRGAGPKGRVMSEASFDLMTGSGVEEEAGGFRYGYGLGVGQKDGHAIITHSGGMVGYFSNLVGDMDSGLGAIAFVNGPGNPVTITAFAMKLLGALAEGRELPEVPPPADPARVPQAAEYAGVYRSAGGTVAQGAGAADGTGKRATASLAFEADGERLYLCHGGRRIAAERRPSERGGGDNAPPSDDFCIVHPDFALFPLKFGRQDGKVVEVSYGSERYVNDQYSGPAVFEYPKGWDAYVGHYRTAHPWYSNFRVIIRKGELIEVSPQGYEIPLVPQGGGVFREGKEDWMPDQLVFDAIINGRAQLVTRSGCEYCRALTP